MKIHVNFEWEVPRWLKHGLHVGLPLLVLVSGAGVAWAALTNFKSGDALSSKDVNANFQSLQDQISAVSTVVTRSGVQISTNGVFCSASKSPTTGSVTYGTKVGYAGAKAACEDACKSPAAHMCTGEEMVRSVAIGVADIPPGDLWIATGVRSANATNGTLVSDCNGFTATDNMGSTWAGNVPSWGNCNSSPGPSIACCL